MSDEVKRPDFEEGLRYIHQMEIEGRIEQHAIAADVAALKALLLEKGIVLESDFASRRADIESEQGQMRKNRRFPSFGDPEDKYLAISPDIPCAELIPICRAACCNLNFSLSIQDIEEGIVRWKYDEPYVVQKGPTGKCVHFGGGCQVYEHRPRTCRRFDCRDDIRIWKDYEKRIPSDYVAEIAPVP